MGYQLFPRLKNRYTYFCFFYRSFKNQVNSFEKSARGTEEKAMNNFMAFLELLRNLALLLLALCVNTRLKSQQRQQWKDIHQKPGNDPSQQTALNFQRKNVESRSFLPPTFYFCSRAEKKRNFYAKKGDMIETRNEWDANFMHFLIIIIIFQFDKHKHM